MTIGVFLLIILIMGMTLLSQYPSVFSSKNTNSKRDTSLLPINSVNESKVIREIVHRVKNHMQLINSLISLQIRSYQGEEATVFLQECQKRIYTVMIVYQQDHEEFVNDTIRVPQYIYELTDYLKLVFKEKQISLIHFDFEITVPYLSTDLCTPMGLIINELLCNSLQHAKQENEKLKIYLRINEDTNHYIHIEYYDTGILSKVPDAKKLGLELAHLMVDQLKGRIHVAINPFSNLTYQIQFPNFNFN